MAKAAEVPQELQVGDGLYVMMVPVNELKERDINAQMMKPRHFDRLVENIRARGQVESLPYVTWPNRQGPKVIVSGHHRSRAARAAGVDVIPCLVDTWEMTESLTTSKQVAHNEIHGDPDQTVLAMMLAGIDNPDDMLATGLDVDQLPVPPDADTGFGLPDASPEYHTVSFIFLSGQLTDFKQFLDDVDAATELTGLAQLDQWEEFCRAVIEFSRHRQIRSMSMAVGELCRIARREAENHRRELEDAAAAKALTRDG